jgi:hypothetical protein
MRDVMEVLLEAVPTAVVQAVVFVVGNTPDVGYYLDTRVYLFPAVCSCVQIVRLLATVLWRALDENISPGKALVDQLLWRDAPGLPGSKNANVLPSAAGARVAVV